MKVKLIWALAAISAVVIIVTSVSVKLSTTPNPPVPTATIPPNVVDIAKDVNNERIKAGEQPLIDDAKLDAASQAKCADMIQYNYVAHDSPQGKVPLDFISVAYPRYSAWGENLAENYVSSQATVDAWMASPGHRANILNAQFTQVGYAICSVNAQYPTVVVQQFVGL